MLLGIPVGAISLNGAELDVKPISDEEACQPRPDIRAAAQDMPKREPNLLADTDCV